MDTNKLLFLAAGAGVVWYLYDQSQKQKDEKLLVDAEDEETEAAAAAVPPKPLPTTKEGAEQRVAEVQSALRAGDPAPLNALLTQLLPASAKEITQPTPSQQLVGEAFAMPLMAMGMSLMSGKTLPGEELDYYIDMAKTIVRHPKVRKLARQQLKLPGKGHLDLADLAEQQTKEQIEKGTLTPQTIRQGLSQMTPDRKLSVKQILKRSKARGLLKRIPAIPGYNITFNKFVKTFKVVPGSKAVAVRITKVSDIARKNPSSLGCLYDGPLALANPLSDAFTQPALGSGALGYY
jgi:hypothetical protein